MTTDTAAADTTARPASAGTAAGTAGAEPASAKVRGPGRTLVAVYAVFAVAATSRAVVQIITKFHEAPVAYLLSALAGVIYILATVGLSRPSTLGRRIATGACAAELTGVLAVGTLSVVDRGLFPDAAVWSGYGEGYFFLPLVLPVLGLWWLRRAAQSAAAEPALAGSVLAGSALAGSVLAEPAVPASVAAGSVAAGSVAAGSGVAEPAVPGSVATHAPESGAAESVRAQWEQTAADVATPNVPTS